MERSLVTKKRQKKPFHHNETGREYKGMRGLAGLPQAAAEVLEGYFSSCVVEGSS